MNLKTKIASGLVTGVVLAGVIVPAGAFASTVKVSGNGAHSTNSVSLSNNSNSSVKQVNKTSVANLVEVGQNTGGNKANKNTGGNVMVSSGNAKSTVTNTTTVGGNALVSTCNSCGSSANDSVKIKGNGANSNNSVTLTNSSSSCTTQVNETMVVNGVLVEQNTGENNANMNTGGSVNVGSGNAESTVTNNTMTGDNVIAPAI